MRPIGSHYIALGSINLHGDGPLLDTTHYTPSNGTLGTWSPPPHVGPVLDRAPVIVPTPYITDYSITRWNGDWQSTSHYGQWQFPLGNRVVYDFLNEIGIFLGFEQDGMGP